MSATLASVNGSAPATRQTITYDNSDKRVVKVTLGSGSNADLVWAGANNDFWRATNKWLNNAAPDTFIDGDTVTFNNLGTQTVRLGTSDVTVADMTVTGGDYTFTGDGVGIRTAPTAATGKLDIQGGKVTLASTGVTNFVEGAAVASGATLQLGNENNGGTFVGKIANAGSLILARTGQYSLNNTITGGGTVTMNDLDAELTFSGTSSNLFVQNGGTVRLTGSMTGGYTQNAGTTNTSKLTGSGTITGTSTFKDVVAPTGELTVADAYLDGMTLHIGTLGPDVLTLTGTPTFGAMNTLDLGRWDIGTYTVIDGPVGADYTGKFDNEVTVNGQSLSDRQHAVFTTTTDDLIVTFSASSATRTWNGSVDGWWNTTSANWIEGDKKYAEGDIVHFVGGLSNRNITVQSGGVKVGDMVVDGADGYTFGGGSITADATSYSGTETASGKLIKKGAGTLTLNNANDFIGGTDIIDGRVEMGNAAALGTQPITMTGGTLGFLGGYALTNDVTLSGAATLDTGSNAVALDGTVSGTAGFTKTGTGTLTLSGVNSYAGGTTITSGKIVSKNASALGAGSVNVGVNTLDLDFDGTLNGGNTISGTGILNVKNNVAINHANAGFSGTTNVDSAKTLTLGNAYALQASGLKLASGAALTVNQASTVDSLTASGATINMGVPGNTLTADSFTMSGSNTISIDSNAAGIYTLLSSTNDVSAWNSSVVNAQTGLRDAVRETATQLQYQILAGPATLYWNGNGGSWNTTDKNFSTADDFDFAFQNGDSVVFDNSVTNKTVTVDAGGVSVGSMTVSDPGYQFNLTAGATAAISATGIVDLGGAALNITGYTPGFDNPFDHPVETQTLIHTTGGVQNFNPLVTVAGQPTADFLSASAFLEGNDVKVETRLTWYSTDPNRPAHGNFTIADGQTFTLGAALADTTSNAGWDGKSLTKLGSGTLVLTGNNTTDGDFNHDEGAIDLRSDWHGRYLQAAGTTLDADDRISIGKAGTTSQLNGTVNPTGTLNVLGDLELTGATMNVDLAYDGTTTTSDKIVAQGDVTVTGGELHVNDEDKILVDAVRQAGSVDFGVLESGGAMTGSFGSLTGFSSSFFSTSHGISGNRYLITVAYNEQTRFADYAWNHNTGAVANNLDASMNDPAMQDLINGLIGDDARILAGLDTLRGTELAADAQAMTLWNPWEIVYKRLYAEDAIRYRTDYRGQSGKRSNRDAWVEGYYRDIDVRGDGNAVSYDGRRGGTMVGIDSRLNHWSKIGVVFGYGEPRVSNRFGRIEADDYTLGLYSKVRVVNELYANAFLGYGRQNYDSRRTDIAGLHRAKYDGDSMYASLEFFRPLKWRNDFTLLPLVALDYQANWSDGFTESGDYGQKVEKADMDRLVLRVGLNSKIRWSDRLNVATRLQYGYLVGGDVYGIANARFAAASPASPVMGLRGVNLGRNMFNAGLGGEWKLTNRIRLFADYDFDLGDRSTAHTGQVGLVTNW